MTTDELKMLPELIATGKLSKKEAVDKIGGFINQNYPIFGLHKYDEDFRSEIMLAFLERGEKILDTYHKDTSDFFTYLFTNIKSMVNTKKKTKAIQALKDTIDLTEGINISNEKMCIYKNYNPYERNLQEVPYAYKPKNVEALKQMFRELSKENTDKKILVLAIKSSFYITDQQIKKVCQMYNLKEEDLYDAIQYCKDSVEEKSIKRSKVQERRNFAYYHHKRYSRQLEKYSEPDFQDDYVTKNNLLRKQIKHFKNWKRLNKKFSDGFLFLRPTNKTVADLLGICERQVSYYINCAKRDLEKAKKNKKSDA